jgi:hypothetical protein
MANLAWNKRFVNCSRKARELGIMPGLFSHRRKVNCRYGFCRCREIWGKQINLFSGVEESA